MIGNKHVSFEIFPPKNTTGLRQIYQTIAHLKNLGPDFFSVTYGANGTTAGKSLEIASAVQNLAEIECVAHFTCIGMNHQDVKKLLEELKSQGIKNILALRGDLPNQIQPGQLLQNSFQYASGLVEYIRSISDIGILVAGYPEGHPDNPSQEDDFQHLLTKVKAGASGIITQLFFDNRYMIDFANKLEQANINIPVSAGIFPVSNFKQITKILEISNVTIPKILQQALERYQDSPQDLEKFGTDYAVQQVENLLKGGISNFHFYTMNRYTQTKAILKKLQNFFPKLNNQYLN